MKTCIVYSSTTGNTRKVAEALAAASGVPCFPVREAPDPEEYDVLALGFWVRLARPDDRSQRYMQRVAGKKVFFFGTMGAWPDSPHAQRCQESTRALLEEGGNTILDGFLCQGRVNPKIQEVSRQKGRHPMTPERQARLDEAARHPDAADLAEAGRRWQTALKQAAVEEDFSGACHKGELYASAQA